MSYLMESATEGARLAAQARVTPLAQRLVQAGLTAGARVLDAGCGSGAGAPEVLAIIGPEGRYTGIDPSADRLAEARRAVSDPRATFEQSALPGTGLPEASFGFTFSQFVFEYLADPASALAELVRLTRPGGRVAVVDVDRLGLDFWPRPTPVEQGQAIFLDAVRARHFDTEIGRKMFSLFRAAGLTDVRVEPSMQYLVAGPAGEQLMADWAQRFEVLGPAVAPAFGSDRAYREFVSAYLAMLADPDSVKWLLVLTTSGTRR